MIDEPPRLAAWLLRHLLPLDRQNEVVRGDLLEEFRRRAALQTLGSVRAARLWYWREALSLLFRGHGYKNMLTLDNLLQDLRFACRSYAKAPSFTALVVLTLALGVGSSTAIFSIVNGILLRPLPLAEADRLMWISEANARGNNLSVSWPDFLDWRRRQNSCVTIATGVAPGVSSASVKLRPSTGCTAMVLKNAAVTVRPRMRCAWPPPVSVNVL